MRKRAILLVAWRPVAVAVLGQIVAHSPVSPRSRYQRREQTLPEWECLRGSTILLMEINWLEAIPLAEPPAGPRSRNNVMGISATTGRRYRRYPSAYARGMMF